MAAQHQMDVPAVEQRQLARLHLAFGRCDESAPFAVCEGYVRLQSG